MRRNPAYPNRRQYIRLDSVFPVQFRITDSEGKQFTSDWIQGFTHNVSRGGLRLDVNNLSPGYRELLKSGTAGLFLQIHMPLSRPPVNAQARIAWVSDAEDKENRCLIGLIFQEINEVGEKRIMRLVMAKVLFMPGVLTLLFLLGLGFAVNGYVSIQLVKGNKALVQQLIRILQESIVAKQKIDQISREKQDLQLKIGTLEVRIQTVEDEKARFAKEAEVDQVKSATSLKELNRIIEQLTQEKSALQGQLIGLQHKESAVTEELLQIDQKKNVLEKANFEMMYRWLMVHQSSRTGLVISFEGDKDVADQAFIYDQALALLAYVYFSDFERARAVLDFFSRKAKRIDGYFLNAYFAQDGSPAEYTRHSGPNIWLGIAALQYAGKAKDNRYLGLAEEIAAVILKAQQKTKDGAIPGGPGLEWYSTEHNLDGYAFFAMLYQMTKKEAYRQARDAVLAWLAGSTYAKHGIPVMRGKGDATIATDTYAWSIAAVGPAELEEAGLNPDKVLEFAEEQCGVQAQFVRPDGQRIPVKGFDFCAPAHAGRGGVVSSEWTAQMIIAYKIMAEYYQAKEMSSKARSYEEKADAYMQQLYSMIISSPSPSGQGEGCLPYASTDAVDTGHGWITPKGRATGSVAATAYALFAYYGYNPLRLAE